LVVNVVPIRTKDFNWSLTFNYAKNKSKVVELDGENLEYTISTPSATNVTLKAIVGEPVGQLFSTSRLLDESTGKVILNDSPGIDYGLPRVSTTLTTYVGNMNPDWTGGISSNFSYKGFYLNFLLDIRMGGYIYLNSMLRMNGNGMTKETLQGRDTWYPFFADYVRQVGYNPYATPGTGSANLVSLYEAASAAKAGVYVEGIAQSTGQPMAGYVNPQRFFAQNIGYGQDHFFYEMNNIRLREVSIGYKFPDKWFNGLPIQSVKLSAVATNVCFLYNNLPSFDPESTYTSGNAYGVETASIPPTRGLGFNLNVTF